MTTSTSQQRDYSDETVVHRNRLHPRSYYIPDTSISLNGTWDFNYSATPDEAPDPRTWSHAPGTRAATPSSDTSLDLDVRDQKWAPISVPGHWQLQGYGRPQYTNIDFPFSVCPPYAPTENLTGTYMRDFYVPSQWDHSSQIRLRFDGVDSAFYVWLNGEDVGYSQGSRNPAEFDVSQLVRRKEKNHVLVKVMQWSDGSYIEDQDQWWLSGKHDDEDHLESRC